MIYGSKTIEQDCVLRVAADMCAAARTAPKAKGQDFILTAVLTGDEKAEVSAKMRETGERTGAAFFLRDAGNIDAATALVLIGTASEYRGLDRLCGLCGFDGCDSCRAAGAQCVYNPLDLGIAVGSAVSVAADRRIDNRVLFSAGRAAMELGILGDSATMIFAIPLSVSGKSPFFDRKAR